MKKILGLNGQVATINNQAYSIELEDKTVTLGVNAPTTVVPSSGKILSSVPITLDTSVIKAGNIAQGITMLGVLGTYNGGIEPQLISGSQVNSYASAYLTAAKTTYASDPNRTTSIISQYYAQISGVRKDEPIPLTVETEAGTMILHDDAGNGSQQKTVTAGSQNIYNISPAGGELTVVGNEAITDIGLIRPTGECRMIYAPSIQNVRDLGGWSCYNGQGNVEGTIKYGLLFRGADPLQATAADKRMFVDYLGVRYEIDLGTNEQSSSFDDNVIYVPCYLTGGNPYVYINLEGQYYQQIKKAIKALMDAVAQGEASYFHCTVGADRTGTTAFLLGALLGKNEVDLDIDYELSSFSTCGLRTRNGQGSASGLSAGYPTMVNYVKSLSTTGTIRDGAVAWCILVGITIEDINAFRVNMINGTPEIVVPHIFAPTQSISFSQQSGTLEADETMTLTATRTPAYASDSITWASSSEHATVVGNGETATITAVSEGSASITATANGHTATFSLTVENTPVLPEGYTQVEYLKSTGSQYINTGITPFTSGTISFDVMFDVAAQGYIYGVYDTKFYFGATSIDTGNRLRLSCANSGEYGATMVTNHKYHGDIVVNGANAKAYIDGSLAINVTGTSTSYHNPIYLFADNNNSVADRLLNGKIYSFSVKDGQGNYTARYIPCYRNSDSKPGMYDVVADTFLVNQGTGTDFTVGGVIGGCTVTNVLSHVSNSNQASSVDLNEPYTGTLTADSGYTIDSVSIVMNSVDVTSTVYSSGVINIPSVTGNIVITASAEISLPSGYQRVEYLQSNGTQYIDTGIAPSATNFDGYVKYKFISTTPSTSVVYGNKSSYYGYYLYRKSSNICTAIGGTTAISVGTYDLNEHETTTKLLNGNRTTTLDNITVTGVYTTSEIVTEYSIYLFGANSSNSIRYSMVGNIYGASFKNNNILVRNFIPCYRISDSKPGMYDTVTNTFFTNAGTGTDFTVGADVN